MNEGIHPNKTFTAKERKQSILNTLTIKTDPTAKGKLNSLITQYENEAKSLGTEIWAEEAESNQTLIKK